MIANVGESLWVFRQDIFASSVERMRVVVCAFVSVAMSVVGVAMTVIGTVLIMALGALDAPIHALNFIL